ncbi:MAG: alkyl/aryl-sulfatase [Cyanobacteria bacterium SBLK]|nr:alkyl/aryl-sulfatase [Cyanobacteria bacterium SBLK]
MNFAFNRNAIANILKLLGLLGLLFFLNSPSLLAKNLASSPRECQPEIIEVTSGVYVAVGNTRANITLIEGDDGAIVIDTGDNIETATRVLSQFREITQKPIKAIVYTHSHSDHTGGTKAFLTGDRPPIYARANFQYGRIDNRKIQQINHQRNERQHGIFLNSEENASLNKMWCKLPLENNGDGFVPPTHFFTETQLSLNIAGVALEFISAPGESQDHLYVWLPDKQVLVCGDNYYNAFPNLYAIRGSYRDPQQWSRSLDKILDRKPEYLISGHSLPIAGAEKIQRIITDYRNGIASIFEQTLAGMNRGLTPDELVEIVKLSPELAGKSYLQENYGNIPWTVRGIYSYYLGWFDGNPTHLFPLSTLEQATRITQLAGGKEQLWQATQKAFDDGDDRWALQLTDYLITLEFRGETVKQLKAKILKKLAERATNSNAHNYYLSSAKQLE